VIAAMVVAIPARDEEALLPACLASVTRAAAHPALADVDVEVVVAADRCRDATVERARAADVRVVCDAFGTVGAARRAAVAAGLARTTGVRRERTWIAMTDADSRVPADWLAVHRQHADAGWSAVLGTVSLAPLATLAHAHADAEVSPEVRGRWTADYRAAIATDHGGAHAHPHVHGANLGVRGDVYTAVGGVPALPAHEDRALLEAITRRGAPVLRTIAIPVATAARRRSRAPDGVGADLRRLADATDVATPA
jgi:glycosyltransferase involved in cell wall biosynthesis